MIDCTVVVKKYMVKRNEIHIINENKLIKPKTSQEFPRPPRRIEQYIFFLSSTEPFTTGVK